MKQVIEGKMYDTETATQIGSNCYGYPGDFDFVLEELYITQKGNLFLYGTGGPTSKYSEKAGGIMYTGGSNIRRMSKEEAFIWCEDHDCTETIEDYFSDMIEEA